VRNIRGIIKLVDDEYKKFVEDNIQRLKAAGVQPCEKHGWQSMNADGSCETCKKEDFPEDFRGTE
jgi:hypothetical protein